MIPIFLQVVRVVGVVDYVATAESAWYMAMAWHECVRDQTAQLVSMQPAAAEAPIRQGHEKTNSGELCVPFGFVGRPVREGADTSILFVDEVNEIRVAIMKARWERLVLDHAIQFDYEH